MQALLPRVPGWMIARPPAQMQMKINLNYLILLIYLSINTI
jgi:hypothetical protein